MWLLVRWSRASRVVQQGLCRRCSRLQVKLVHCGWLMCVMLWWRMVRFLRIGAGAGWWMFTRERVIPWHVAHTEALSCWNMQWRCWGLSCKKDYYSFDFENDSPMLQRYSVVNGRTSKRPIKWYNLHFLNLNLIETCLTLLQIVVFVDRKLKLMSVKAGVNSHPW